MTHTQLDLGPAEAALGRIRAEPESHVQGAWRCQAGMCMAGHVAETSGAQWAFHSRVSQSDLAALVLAAPAGVLVATQLEHYMRYLWEGYAQGEVEARVEAAMLCAAPGVTQQSLVVHVQDYARALLGLSDVEASALFAPDNTREDLERGVKALANGQGIGRHATDQRLVELLERGSSW